MGELGAVLLIADESRVSLSSGFVVPSCSSREHCQNRSHQIARLAFEALTESWPRALPCELDGEFLLVGVSILSNKMTQSGSARHFALYVALDPDAPAFPVTLPHPWTSCLLPAKKALVIALDLDGRLVEEDVSHVRQWLEHGDRVPMLPKLTFDRASQEAFEVRDLAHLIMSNGSGTKKVTASETARLRATSERFLQRKINRRNRDRDALRQRRKFDDDEDDEAEDAEDEVDDDEEDDEDVDEDADEDEDAEASDGDDAEGSDVEEDDDEADQPGKKRSKP